MICEVDRRSFNVWFLGRVFMDAGRVTFSCDCWRFYWMEMENVDEYYFLSWIYWIEYMAKCS